MASTVAVATTDLAEPLGAVGQLVGQLAPPDVAAAARSASDEPIIFGMGARGVRRQASSIQPPVKGQPKGQLKGQAKGQLQGKFDVKGQLPVGASDNLWGSYVGLARPAPAVPAAPAASSGKGKGKADRASSKSRKASSSGGKASSKPSSKGGTASSSARPAPSAAPKAARPAAREYGEQGLADVRQVRGDGVWHDVDTDGVPGFKILVGDVPEYVTLEEVASLMQRVGCQTIGCAQKEIGQFRPAFWIMSGQVSRGHVRLCQLMNKCMGRLSGFNRDQARLASLGVCLGSQCGFDVYCVCVYRRRSFSIGELVWLCLCHCSSCPEFRVVISLWFFG